MAIRNWCNDKLGQLQTGANTKLGQSQTGTNTKIGAVTKWEKLVDSEENP